MEVCLCLFIADMKVDPDKEKRPPPKERTISQRKKFYKWKILSYSKPRAHEKILFHIKFL